MKKVEESKYIDGVQRLICLAEINIKLCQKIYTKYYKADASYNKPDFWLLTANNAFFTSIEILFTLLSSSREEELRIEPVLKDPTELSEFEGFKKKFEDKRFHVARHTAVAHKHQIIDDPAGASCRLIDIGFRQEIEEIATGLRACSQKWFNYEDRNPNDSILKELDELFAK